MYTYLTLHTLLFVLSYGYKAYCVLQPCLGGIHQVTAAAKFLIKLDLSPFSALA